MGEGPQGAFRGSWCSFMRDREREGAWHNASMGVNLGDVYTGLVS